MFTQFARKHFTSHTSQCIKTPLSSYIRSFSNNSKFASLYNMSQSTQLSLYTQLNSKKRIPLSPLYLLSASTVPLTMETSATTQEREIVQQLTNKYGLSSNETKEFILTSAEVPSDDELRMLSPCGKHYTNYLFYNILYTRFDKHETISNARDSITSYQQCLVENVDDELKFWNKVRELTQISTGFVKGMIDHHQRMVASKDNDKEPEQSPETKEIENQVEKLDKVAKKKIANTF